MAMMDIFGAAPNPAFVRSSGTPRGTEEGASTPGAVTVLDQSRVDGEAAVEDNPWDGYDAPRQDPPTREKRKGEDRWFCPQHGPLCTPGICEARAQVERDERWQKEREEREEKKRRWKERRGRRPRRRPDGREAPRGDQPAHLANGPREASSSRGSGSETEEESSDQGAILFERASEMNIHLTRIGILTRFVAQY